LNYGIFDLNLKSLKDPNMKRILSLFVLLSACFFVDAQSSTSTEDVLRLKEVEHNFGTIPQGKPVFYTFVITNTGTKPLSLDNVAATCGCTTPEWSHDPIAPGASANIRVGYNAATPNDFEKFITITYNNNQTKQLKITGTVWKAPESSAPANASVQFLKTQTL
jgi:hypothetical protein